MHKFLLLFLMFLPVSVMGQQSPAGTYDVSIIETLTASNGNQTPVHVTETWILGEKQPYTDYTGFFDGVGTVTRIDGDTTLQGFYNTTVAGNYIVFWSQDFTTVLGHIDGSQIVIKNGDSLLDFGGVLMRHAEININDYFGLRRFCP